MDTQEKIARLYLAVGDWDKLSPAARHGYLDRAGAIIGTLEQLGYRKPLDRPELEREINEAIRLGLHSFENGTPLNVAQETIFDDIMYEVTKSLPLIPDIPKDKEALLTDKELRAATLKEVAEHLERHPEDLDYGRRWLFIIRLKAGLL